MRVGTKSVQYGTEGALLPEEYIQQQLFSSVDSREEAF